MALAHPPPHFFPTQFGALIRQEIPFPAVRFLDLPVVDGHCARCRSNVPGAEDLPERPARCREPRSRLGIMPPDCRPSGPVTNAQMNPNPWPPPAWRSACRTNGRHMTRLLPLFTLALSAWPQTAVRHPDLSGTWKMDASRSEYRDHPRGQRSPFPRDPQPEARRLGDYFHRRLGRASNGQSPLGRRPARG
jgi:hypothetical protein